MTPTVREDPSLSGAYARQVTGSRFKANWMLSYSPLRSCPPDLMMRVASCGIWEGRGIMPILSAFAPASVAPTISSAIAAAVAAPACTGAATVIAASACALVAAAAIALAVVAAVA